MDYNKVWSLINKVEMSKRAMSKIVGMSSQGWNTMMNNKTMTVEVLEKTANYFKVPLSYFYDSDDIEKIVSEPMTKKGSCLDCIEKQKKLDMNEAMIKLQDKLIAEYELQLGKKKSSSCG